MQYIPLHSRRSTLTSNILYLYPEIFNLLEGFPKLNKADEVVVDVVMVVEVVEVVCVVVVVLDVLVDVVVLVEVVVG